jgi:phosphinothricin acetyltransferase
MEIYLRPYIESDAQTILEIINYNIINSTSLYDYNPRTLEQQKYILQDKITKGYPVIVAILNNEVVGFGSYSEFRFREAYKYTVEHSIYVSNNFQGIRIGHLLIEELIKIARNQKLHTMIGVIDAENQGSVKFHQKYGFKNVGVIKESGYKFDRWLDSVFMQLILK